MVKLFCAIIGAGGSAFPVDIDEGESVGDLKKAIKAKNPNSMTCDANELQLFLAAKDGAWLKSNTEDVEKLENGEKAAAIEALMQEDSELRGTFGLREVLTAMPSPSTRQIHVLVKVPKEEVAVPRDSRALQELIEKVVTKVLDARDNKRSIYSLSDLESEHKERMAKKMRLTDDYRIVDEPSNALIPGYTWLNVPEDADEQRAGYMAYLETHFERVLKEQELSWLDVAKDETVLSVRDPRLPFEMAGTADVLLVDGRSTQHRVPLAGVRMVVELKKKVESRHKPQAFGELVAASLKAPQNCTPIGLLTDLNDRWYFSWFNAEKTLTHVALTHPKNAFDFIAAAVAEPGSASSSNVPFINGPFTKLKIGDFLPRPDDYADEMMERYELMADVVEPEFLLARRMEYAQHLAESRPMYAHLYP